MAEFMSYKPLLIKYLKIIKPKYILEWGTGKSTGIINRVCPDSEIHTIEHDVNWFLKWHQIYKEQSKIKMYYANLGDNYYSLPKGFVQREQFKLIFIDGRMRVKCMITSTKVVAPDGVVILHDSERVVYEEGKRLFSIIEETNGTSVMRV